MDNRDRTTVKAHGCLKRKASSSFTSPEKSKRLKSNDTFIAPSVSPSVKSSGRSNRFKSDETFIAPSPSPSVKSLGKQKRSKFDNTAHGLSLSSSVNSSGRQKQLPSDDASSILSLTNSMAYGAHEDSDEYDLDYDLLSTTENERPVNFIKLNTSQLNRNNGVLFSEDITSDYEIWTLQCPDDVDINELHEKSINFSEVSTLKVKNSMSHKVDLIPYKSQEDTNITIVTPSEKTNDLSLNVVSLAGTLIMSNRVRKEKSANKSLLPVDTIEDATRRRSELMTRITKRLSNKYDINTAHCIKKEFEVLSPKKVKKKSKQKLIN